MLKLEDFKLNSLQGTLNIYGGKKIPSKYSSNDGTSGTDTVHTETSDGSHSMGDYNRDLIKRRINVRNHNMVSYILLVFIIFIPNCIFGQDDYINYHTKLNEAEVLYFIENDCIGSLDIYSEIFSKYEFSFAHDIVNAIEISFDCKSRKEYLDRIDFGLLLRTYDLYLKDQIEKKSDQKVYDNFKKDQIWKLSSLFLEFGFPSEKLIGIEDRNIFKEIGRPKYDFENRKLSFNYPFKYTDIEDNLIGSAYLLVMLIHDRCSISNFENFYLQAIKKGEFHPREYAVIFDNFYRIKVNSKKYSCPRLVQKGYFKLNPFLDYSLVPFFSNEEINKLRSKWYINTIEVDMAKNQKEISGYKFLWGFNDCL